MPRDPDVVARRKADHAAIASARSVNASQHVHRTGVGGQVDVARGDGGIRVEVEIPLQHFIVAFAREAGSFQPPVHAVEIGDVRSPYGDRTADVVASSVRADESTGEAGSACGGNIDIAGIGTRCAA